MRRLLIPCLALGLVAIGVPRAAAEPGRRLADRSQVRTLDVPRPASEASGGVVPGEIVVTYREAPGVAARAATRARVLGALEARAAGPRFDVIRVVPGREARSMAALRADPNVVAAEPNRVRTAATHGDGAAPSDPLFDEQWGLLNTTQFGYGTAGADISAEEAWDTTTGDGSIIVAVVDTGVALTHPDLSGQLWVNAGDPLGGGDDDLNGFLDDVNGWDWVDEDNDPTDENGHGSHVAGIAAAAGGNAAGITGVAWDAEIMALRVLDAEGSGTDADIAAAFDYAGDMGAHVVNASLGGGGPEPAAFVAAISSHPGTLYVVAAGNGGEDGIGDNVDVTPDWPCSHTLENLICVGASDESDGRASFSNFGNASVDLAAPGVNIWSTTPMGSTASSGSYSLADSPSGTHANDLEVYVDLVDAVDLSTNTGCHLLLDMMLDTDGTDQFFVLGATMADFSDAAFLTGYTGRTFGEYVSLSPGDPIVPAPSLDPFEGGSMYLTVGFFSDGAIRRDGVYLDNIDITCTTGPDPLANQGFESGDLTGWAPFMDAPWGVSDGTYFPFEGTSMATPHVAGAAALLWEFQGAQSDDVWAQHVRGLLLGGVDKAEAWMKKKLAYDGRLNLARAVSNVGDLAAPDAPSILSNAVGSRWQSSRAFNVRASVIDDADTGGSGIWGYEMRRRAARYNKSFGAWKTWHRGDRKTKFSEGTGFTYCFAARALDRALNEGQWGAKRCTAVPVNDRDLIRDAKWRKISPGASFMGTALKTKKRGATLKLKSVKARRLALVVTTCSGCGKVKIFKGRKRLATLNLDRAFKKNRVMGITKFGSVKGPMTIRIKVVSSGKKVIVEGLGVSRL